jgi:hypothetical protein
MREMLRRIFVVVLLGAISAPYSSLSKGLTLDADVQQKMNQSPNAYHWTGLTVKLERQPFRRLRLENRYP